MNFNIEPRTVLLSYFVVGTLVSIILHMGVVRILRRNDPQSAAEERVVTTFAHLHWAEYWMIMLLSMIVWPLLVFKGLVNGKGEDDAS